MDCTRDALGHFTLYLYFAIWSLINWYFLISYWTTLTYLGAGFDNVLKLHEGEWQKRTMCIFPRVYHYLYESSCVCVCVASLCTATQQILNYGLLQYRISLQNSPSTEIWRNGSFHYNDVIMRATASQITSLKVVYSTVYSGTDQRKHQSSTSLAFVWEIHRWPVNSTHKWPVTRKMFPFDDVIM